MDTENLFTCFIFYIFSLLRYNLLSYYYFDFKFTLSNLLLLFTIFDFSYGEKWLSNYKKYFMTFFHIVYMYTISSLFYEILHLFLSKVFYFGFVNTVIVMYASLLILPLNNFFQMDKMQITNKINNNNIELKYIYKIPLRFYKFGLYFLENSDTNYHLIKKKMKNDMVNSFTNIATNKFIKNFGNNLIQKLENLDDLDDIDLSDCRTTYSTKILNNLLSNNNLNMSLNDEEINEVMNIFTKIKKA